MRYQLKQNHCRPWTLNGLSLKPIESQYEKSYGGADTLGGAVKLQP